MLLLMQSRKQYQIPKTLVDRFQVIKAAVVHTCKELKRDMGNDNGGIVIGEVIPKETLYNFCAIGQVPAD
ncbi:50s ribosomal protein l14 [Quercus suber]|uniref:50s ribosomal protein l14 n=1 Tax=Quercus suber TaxID=58331 RepID=A0AAW0JRC8_QUESU